MNNIIPFPSHLANKRHKFRLRCIKLGLDVGPNRIYVTKVIYLTDYIRSVA